MSESYLEQNVFSPSPAEAEVVHVDDSSPRSALRKPPSYTVVIPAYNEGSTIRRLVDQAFRFAANVIVVDDGSTDGTAERVAETGAWIIRHESNRGKGRSLLRGMRAALADGADAVITIDGDLQHKPEDIPRFAEAAERYPDHIVLGSRYNGLGAAPPLRRAANRFADFWVSRAARTRVRDSQCGFRLYPRTAIENVIAGGEQQDGFVFESEFLIEAARRGFRIVSVDIDTIYPAHPVRASHYRPVADTLRIGAMVTRKLLRPER